MRVFKTAKQLYRHTDTGEIYAVESSWDGTLIGAAGPLTEPLRNLADYECTPDNNDWVESQNDKLILI